MHFNFSANVTHAIYLNLDRRPDRNVKTIALLELLRVQYVRQPAIDGGSFPASERIPQSLNAQEWACLLGHRAMWQRVAESDSPWLVMEDDAIPCQSITDHWFVERFSLPEDIELLQLGVSWPGKSHRISLQERELHIISSRVRIMDSFRGAFASVIWPGGAKKLLESSLRSPTWPADWHASRLQQEGALRAFVIFPTWFIANGDSDIATRASPSKRFGNVWEDFRL